MKPVKVAIADDSAFIRKALVRILRAEPRIEVVGTATCGEELLDHLEEWRPDVISLDLSMPGIGGLRTLDRIMERQPTPVIILSTHARESAPLTIEALHRGAVDFIDKQRYSLVDFQTLSRILIERILEIAGKKEAHERQTSREAPPGGAATVVAPAPGPLEETETAFKCSQELVIIAASTGGPMAIQTVLEGFPARPPVPIILIQHMPPDFTGAFADRLNNHLPFAVRHAADGELLLPGTAYVGPGGHQFELARSPSGLAAVISEDSMSRRHSPSADITFESAAAVVGKRVLAAVLTGMGRDGAEGLAKLTTLGAHAVAQDRKTSIVFGMPKEAIARGGIAEVLALGDIGPRLWQLLHSEAGDSAVKFE